MALSIALPTKTVCFIHLTHLFSTLTYLTKPPVYIMVWTTHSTDKQQCEMSAEHTIHNPDNEHTAQ